MKDIPIIFSGPMVRALLDGRKTMTRRLPRSQPEILFDDDGQQLPVGIMHVDQDPRPRVTVGRVITRQEIRYAPSDRLWVKENHRLTDCTCTEACRGPGHVWYDADSDGYRNVAHNRCRPSIHMPRWASRLTLALSGVKIERLQDISEEDAQAEGVARNPVQQGTWIDYPEGTSAAGWSTARGSFESLWRSINGKDAWDANPYVVALTFTVHKQNIDTLPKAEAA